MPKPGSMVSILSQSSRVRRFTSRTGRAVPTRMASIRLSTRWNSRSSRRAPRPLASSAAQSWTIELARIAGDGLRRADRLGEGAAHLDQVRRADRLDRFGEASPWPGRDGGRVRGRSAARAARGVLPRDRRCARSRGRTNPPPWSGQAKGGDGQVENGIRAVSRRDDDRGTAPIRASAWAAPQVSAIAARADADAASRATILVSMASSPP